MTPVANLTSAASALQAINIHPHGHKRGSHVEASIDSVSDTAAQVPAGTAQNLFGSLLKSLVQVIGVQSSGSTPATVPPAAGAATQPVPATAASMAPRLAGSGIDVTA